MSSPRLSGNLLLLLFLGLGALLLGARELRAQAVSVQGLPVLGGEAEDRLRLRQLQGTQDQDGFLFRTPSTLLNRFMADREGTVSFTLLAPDFRTIHNSDLPFSLNDGPLWAGAGLNGVVTFGARVKLGPIVLVLAPQWIYQENKPFQVIPYPPGEATERDLNANPFYRPPQSMDYPMRFGTDSVSMGIPGQSSLTVTLGPVSAGVSTENAWWGPGIRNGIVLSSHAPGIPRVFLRSSRPWETPIGSFGAEWILGRLRESDYFDENPDNDVRTLSGVVLTFQPAFDNGLTLGLSRTVYSPVFPGQDEWDAALDIFRSVGRPNDLALDEPGPGRDQLLSLFGRWIFSPYGFEAYGEWVRFQEPASLRDFLLFPQHTQGYTVGLQWVGRGVGHGLLRVQGEMTNLEPSGTWRIREPFSTYASRAVEQGYTERGQVLGASTGPGSSSQWLATDFLSERWRLGAFAGRIRWDAAAGFSEAVEYWGREDVSLFWGLRGGVELLGYDLACEVTTGVRINYLFQTFQPDPVTGRAEGVDVENTTLSVTLSKRLWR